jgi:hypothetical protein
VRSLLLLVALAAPALAQEPPADAPRAAVENLADGTATFTVDGPAKRLPEGTVLHVTLAVQGSHDLPIEAAFFRVLVHQERYLARHTFERALAPAGYVARVELFVSEQGAPVARALRQTFGYAADHREVIAATDLFIGTYEQQAAFRQETLLALREVVVSLKGLHGRVQGALGVPSDAWGPARDAFYDELRARVATLKELRDRHVVSPERQLIDQIQGVHNELTRFVRAHPGGAPHDLERVAHFLDTLQAGIDGRLPRREEPETPEEPR